MKMFYKVSVEFPCPGTGLVMRRSFSFARREEADLFVKVAEGRDGLKITGTSIDHLMDAREVFEEIDEEIDLSMRVAHSEIG